MGARKKYLQAEHSIEDADFALAAQCTTGWWFFAVCSRDLLAAAQDEGVLHVLGLCHSGSLPEVPHHTWQARRSTSMSSFVSLQDYSDRGPEIRPPHRRLVCCMAQSSKKLFVWQH